MKQLPLIFDNCASDLEVMYKLFFEKKVIELTPSTSKVLGDLLQLIQAETPANGTRCSFMDIGIRLLDYFNKVSYAQHPFGTINHFYELIIFRTKSVKSSALNIEMSFWEKSENFSTRKYHTIKTTNKSLCAKQLPDLFISFQR